jgi:serine/threonine-protein kinase
MGLAAGTRLGGYEIVALIGAGGMGEVYRARDTRLKRDVAIKVLLDAFASDADRLARFQREAELLATLNHPNIGAVYGFEQTAESSALVLELIEGETLTDRIHRGPLPIKAALHIARQIAEALDAAHERGVIHRDLKPANIKITPDDKVTVLDFGLAKLADASSVGRDFSRADLSHSPTLSMMATQAGVILGTAAYMSPEQAKGVPADQRSDIFAFGAVLYEMLTGRQPFQGDTAPDVLASVIVREADLNALPANLNPRLRELLERCLEKNPKKRWQAIGDIQTEIEKIIAIGVTVRPDSSLAPKRTGSAALAAAVATSLATGVIVWQLRPSPAAAPAAVARFEFYLAEGQRFTNPGRHLIAMSFDGSQMAFVANQQIYLRTLRTGETKPLPGASNPSGVMCPAFSPDGRYLAFWAATDQTLRKVSVAGGDVPVTLATVDRPYGISWQGTNLFVGQGPEGIVRVPADGGPAETIIKAGTNEIVHGPQLLSDGDSVLFTLAPDTGSDRWDRANIVVQSLKSGQRTVIARGGTDARYISTGHITYARGGTLLAAPFDARTLSLTGPAIPVVEGVRRTTGAAVNTGVAQYAVSDTGTLMYIPGSAVGTQRYLALLDRSGVVAPLKLPPGHYTGPRLSPDGKVVAFQLTSGQGADIWIYELSGTTAMQRLTFDGESRYPVWAADGRRITYQSNRDGERGLFWQSADGSGSVERLTKSDTAHSHVPDAWSPDGKALLYSVNTVESSALDWSLWMLSHPDKKTSPVGKIRASFSVDAVFSPDGRWIAYNVSDPAGRAVFVEPFPVTGAKFQVATGESVGHPLWGPDGNELFYANGPLTMRTVSIMTTPTFRIGIPSNVPGQRVHDRSAGRSYDVFRDGSFVGVVESNGTEQAGAEEIRVVLNWFEELKQRVPLTRD